MDSASEAGRFLFQHSVMEMRVLQNGAFEFKIETDAGNFSVISEEGLAHTTEWQNINVLFDGRAGVLEFSVDENTYVTEGVLGSTKTSIHASTQSTKQWIQTTYRIPNINCISPSPSHRTSTSLCHTWFHTGSR